MPEYLSRKGGSYVFRQGVPAALRGIIGKREVKKSLGSDYAKALSLSKALAHETDRRFQAARAQLADRSRMAHRNFNEVVVIREITPEFIAQFRARWMAIVDAADMQRRTGGLKNVPQAEIDEVLEDQHAIVPDLRKALSTGDVSAFIHPTHQTLFMMGYRLADSLLGTSDERRLALEMVRGALEGSKITAARDEGEDPPVVLPAEPLPLTTAAATKPATAPDGTLMLSELITQFTAAWAKTPKTAMLRKHNTVLPLLLLFVGDRPITALRQTQINEFFDFVHRLPPRWHDACKAQQISPLELAKTEHPVTLGPTTLEDTYIASVRLFLKTCRRTHQDVGFPTTLTTKGIQYLGERKAGENKQRAFLPDELKKLFEGPKYTRFAAKPTLLHKFWLPVIGLYTGARINEICQLNPQADVRMRDGVLCLELTTETPAAKGIKKSIKTKKNRSVPIHQHLLELGLAEYLAALKKKGETQIFPAWPARDGRASPSAGAWFSRFLDSIGLHGVTNEAGKALRGSHAFRHTLLTYGRLTGVRLRCITGHADASRDEGEDINVVAEGYEDETILTPIREKQQLLNRLDYKLSIPKPVPLK